MWIPTVTARWMAAACVVAGLLGAAGGHAQDAAAGSISGRTLTLDPLVLDGYIGTYQSEPHVFIVISREGTHLYAQITGQTKFEIYPENDVEFSSKAANARVTFTTENTGRSTDIEVRKDGHAYLGPRTAPQP